MNWQRFDSGKEEVATSQRLSECLQGHFAAAGQARCREYLGLHRAIPRSGHLRDGDPQSESCATIAGIGTRTAARDRRYMR